MSPGRWAWAAWCGFWAGCYLAGALAHHHPAWRCAALILAAGASVLAFLLPVGRGSHGS